MNKASEYLLEKYNVPVPRYTSYPTVPCWDEDIDAVRWKDTFVADFKVAGETGISMYIHLPYCESLCTYCGCNKKITTNHSVEEEYIAAIHKEWQMYRATMPHTPVLRELHLGGGTPTFFSPDNLARLLEPVLHEAIIPEGNEFSFEGHPNNTTTEHLQRLYDLGFRRVSYGVQDNDAEVQRVINRIQPLQNVRRAIEAAREIGYTSVNFDLIYGLPRQSIASIARTIKETIELQPDRIAFYSYAHVPWTSRGQRLFDESDLPTTEEKMSMYALGKELFAAAGYNDIGMDHFALPDDELSRARTNGRLHRNFMGYTTAGTSLLLGLGVSSISTTNGAFAQNEKTLHDYLARVFREELPVFRGYFKTEQDKIFSRHILNISCHGATTYQPVEWEVLKTHSGDLLTELAQDGLITFTERQLTVTPQGSNFIRNVCSAFDLHLSRNRIDKEKRVFSKAV